MLTRKWYTFLLLFTLQALQKEEKSWEKENNVVISLL